MYVVINNKYKLNFTISVRTVIMKCSQPKMTNHIADDFIILPTLFVVEVCVHVSLPEGDKHTDQRVSFYTLNQTSVGQNNILHQE